jgi:hypothetical protein
MYKVWIKDLNLKKIKHLNNVMGEGVEKMNERIILVENGVYKCENNYKLYKLDTEKLNPNTLDDYIIEETTKTKIGIHYQNETWNEYKNHDNNYFNNKVAEIQRYIINKGQLVSPIFEYYNNDLYDFYFLTNEDPNHKYIKEEISLFLSEIL